METWKGAPLAQHATQAERLYQHGIRATGAVTIQRDPMTLYAAWRKLSDLPRFIDAIISVDVLDERMSRWVVRGPGDREVTWTAELIRDEPGRMLAWKTVGDPDVASAGTLRFDELAHGRGTEVRVIVEHEPPGGTAGNVVAKWFGQDAKSLLRLGLHRFRQLMETGEIPVSKGQPAGGNSWRQDRPGESDARTTESDLRDIAEQEGKS